MQAYIYRAALYCAPCGEALRERLAADGVQPADDSDAWPIGPYGQGGGEADTPQHCDACHVCLDNPLTGEGAAYVREAISAFDASCGALRRGSRDVIEHWREVYRWTMEGSEA